MKPDYSLKRGMRSSYCNIDLDREFSDRENPYNSLLDTDRHVYYPEFDSITEAVQYRKSTELIEPINEASYKELAKETEYKRKLRATGKLAVYGRKSVITVQYRGVTNKKGWITFQTPSQKKGHKPYTQYIRLNDIKNLKYFKEFKQRDIIRLMLSGDISCFCSCPDFKYRYKYMAHTMGYGMFIETRPPKIRNPKYVGSVCKHLYAVLMVLGFNWTSISKDMQKTKYWNKHYQGEDFERTVSNRKAVLKKNRKKS